MGILSSSKNAHNIAVWLELICWFMVVMAGVVLVLLLLGRVEMNITTADGYYEHALLLERDHGATGRFLFTRLSDQPVFLHTNGPVGFVTWLGIALMGAVRILPMGVCFLFLARFFRNISFHMVFVPQNAALLQKGGAVLLVSALAAPFLNGLVLPALINALSGNRLMISTTISASQLFLGAGLLVMAYVFHYGIYLQDEADHTI